MPYNLPNINTNNERIINELKNNKYVTYTDGDVEAIIEEQVLTIIVENLTTRWLIKILCFD